MKNMENMNVDIIDINELKDIRDVKLDFSMPIEERLRLYRELIKNPYCFKVGNIPVRLRFKSDGSTLDEIVQRHIARVKTGE